MKVKVSVTIDKQVYDRAHDLGINVSKASENYLKLLIETIQKTKVAGGEGFEPSTPNLGEQAWQGTATDWNGFRDYLRAKQYRGGHDKTVYNYAVEYADCLFKRDLSRVRDLRDSLRPNIIKALAMLSKYAGCYEDWQRLLKDYDLRWTGRSKDDVFIDRMNKTQDPEDVWLWVRKAKSVRPELSGLFDLLAVSGLRFNEGVNSYTMIRGLAEEGKLGDYYKDGVLEHWRYKEVFLRSTKKAFVSFVPDDLVRRIREGKPLPNARAIQKLVRRKGLAVRFSDIREAHATYMIKFLKTAELDFLHGRVSSSVFMANYFNPSLIADLKTRTMKGVKEITEKVRR